MPVKFEVGSQVRFTNRAPSYITADLRQRTRRVIDLVYCPTCQANHYRLGDRGKGQQGYEFRSYMLRPATNTHTLGRPREKRKYNKGARQ